MPPKTVFITQRLSKDPSTQEIREALDVKWCDFLMACGLTPIPLSHGLDLKSLNDLWAKLMPAGIIFSGGNDLSHFAPDDALSQKRDSFETTLLKWSLEHTVPILGVCRGMQFIAHYYGCSIAKKSGHVAVDHEVIFNDSNKVFESYGAARQVNSYHHYAVTDVVSPLVECATSEDGVVEAICHNQENIYGMMWHPERYSEFRKCDIQLFQRIFLEENACARLS